MMSPSAPLVAPSQLAVQPYLQSSSLLLGPMIPHYSRDTDAKSAAVTNIEYDWRSDPKHAPHPACTSDQQPPSLQGKQRAAAFSG